MYLALLIVRLPLHPAHSEYPPLRRLPLLLDLCEDAFRLVILAMCARGHLAVALDLLLPAHVARLQLSVGPNNIDGHMYPCNAPPLWVAAAVVVVHVIMCKHIASRHLRGIKSAAAEDARWWRVHHGRALGIETIRRGVHDAEELRSRQWRIREAVMRCVRGGSPGRGVVL